VFFFFQPADVSLTIYDVLIGNVHLKMHVLFLLFSCFTNKIRCNITAMGCRANTRKRKAEFWGERKHDCHMYLTPCWTQIRIPTFTGTTQEGVQLPTNTPKPHLARTCIIKLSSKAVITYYFHSCTCVRPCGRACVRPWFTHLFLRNGWRYLNETW
jgi:hypothetical protein